MVGYPSVLFQYTARHMRFLKPNVPNRLSRNHALPHDRVHTARHQVIPRCSHVLMRGESQYDAGVGNWKPTKPLITWYTFWS